MTAKSQIVHNYCDVVETDLNAHPIQPASTVIPPGVFSIASDLYSYTVCAFDGAGTPLRPDETTARAAWVLFDNVYSRTRGGRFPKNASSRKAHVAGFWPEGQRSGAYGPERAAALWSAVVELWGPPPGYKAGSNEVRTAAVEVPLSEPAKPSGGKLAEVAPTSATPVLWAQAIVNNTRTLWAQLEGGYPFWESGFAVFYSPIPERVKLVIVGANPGGGPESFDLATASAIPARHDYFAYDYALAKRMKELFARADATELLKESVKLNLNFFRSRSSEEWRTASSSARARMEGHSQRAVMELLRSTQPAFVLCEGTATFDRLLDLIGLTGPEVVLQSAGRRAYVRAELPWPGTLAGIIHPTGAQMSNADRQKIADCLRADVAHLL